MLQPPLRDSERLSKMARWLTSAAITQEIWLWSLLMLEEPNIYLNSVGDRRTDR